LAEASGKRNILLHTNGLTSPSALFLNIDTAPLPLEDKVAPYFAISIYLSISIILGLWSSNIGSFPTNTNSSSYNSPYLGQVVGCIFILFGVFLILYLVRESKFIYFILSPATNYLAFPEQRRYSNIFFYLLLCFAIIGGLSLAICLRTGLLMNPYLFYLIRTGSLVPDAFYLILTTFITLGSLAVFLIFTFVISKIQRNRKIAAYHLKEEHLIKP